MFTTETAIDALKKFDIAEETLVSWERELGLTIPVDEYGRKQYSPHHINLFKNVKKHIALGRSLAQIKEIIHLPPSAASKPSSDMVITAAPKGGKPYASVPTRPGLAKLQGESQLVDLVNKLVSEKDQLHKKLIDTEKLNSHLYNANNMFHRKVKELDQQIVGLKGYIGQIQERVKEDRSLKLMDDKAKLQKQVLDGEKLIQMKEQELEAERKLNIQLNEQVSTIEQKLREEIQEIEHQRDHFDPVAFCGDWVEKGSLIEIAYDNFGINIESERARLFRIAEKPANCFGRTASITTQFEYETNNLWKRVESLYVSYVNEERLEGELVAEYILDGVPVAKALYRVTYNRNHNS